nr:putative S-adenosyl-L-methionine-dependent methyltransferase [Tanacetum cinerariifolium]
MGYWLSENATETYLKSMKIGNEPDVAEFISAIAAGNNAQLMVVVSAAAEKSTTLGLVAAAEQTGGHVISIFKGSEDLRSSKQALGSDASRVEFLVGDAQTLLLNSYRNADLVVIDCNLENHEQILDLAEFISAIAAGKNAQHIVVVNAATSATAKSITLGLVAAAEQTGSQVISIFKGTEDLHSSKQAPWVWRESS